MPFHSVAWGGPTIEQRQQISDMLRVRGGSAKPKPARSLIAQPGNGKVLITWNADPANHPNCRARVYVGTEGSLFRENLPGVHRIEVPMTGGATPPLTNVFVSFVSPLGAESRKVSVVCSAAVQAGATPPADPAVPVGWDREPSGGAFIARRPYTLLGVR